MSFTTVAARLSRAHSGSNIDSNHTTNNETSHDSKCCDDLLYDLKNSIRYGQEDNSIYSIHHIHMFLCIHTNSTMAMERSSESSWRKNSWALPRTCVQVCAEGGVSLCWSPDLYAAVSVLGFRAVTRFLHALALGGLDGFGISN